MQCVMVEVDLSALLLEMIEQYLLILPSILEMILSQARMTQSSHNLNMSQSTEPNVDVMIHDLHAQVRKASFYFGYLHKVYMMLINIGSNTNFSMMHISGLSTNGLVLLSQKHGRGAAKNTKFEKIQKSENILLNMKDGETSSCENCTIFTTKVTWLVKHHVDRSHASWHNVPPFI